MLKENVMLHLRKGPFSAVVSIWEGIIAGRTNKREGRSMGERMEGQRNGRMGLRKLF
jgi:hypothetical protein